MTDRMGVLTQPLTERAGHGTGIQDFRNHRAKRRRQVDPYRLHDRYPGHEMHAVCAAGEEGLHAERASKVRSAGGNWHDANFSGYGRCKRLTLTTSKCRQSSLGVGISGRLPLLGATEEGPMLGKVRPQVFATNLAAGGCLNLCTALRWNAPGPPIGDHLRRYTNRRGQSRQPASLGYGYVDRRVEVFHAANTTRDVNACQTPCETQGRRHEISSRHG